MLSIGDDYYEIVDSYYKSDNYQPVNEVPVNNEVDDKTQAPVEGPSDSEKRMIGEEGILKATMPNLQALENTTEIQEQQKEQGNVEKSEEPTTLEAATQVKTLENKTKTLEINWHSTSKYFHIEVKPTEGWTINSPVEVTFVQGEKHVKKKEVISANQDRVHYKIHHKKNKDYKAIVSFTECREVSTEINQTSTDK